MEVFRLGEAVFRTSQPLLPFLAPTAYRIPQTRRTAAAAASTIAAGSQTGRISCSTTRAFSTSRFCKQENVERRSTGAGQPPPAAAPPSSSAEVDDSSIASILNSVMDGSKGTPYAPTSRTSRFASPNAQANNRASRGQANNRETDRPGRSNNSVDDLLASMEKGFRGGSSNNSATRRSGSSSYADIERMIDPRGTLRDMPPSVNVERPRIRLGPTVGRTVQVEPNRGVDVGRAFRSLEILCSRNAVRRDAMRQRFHERPGLKRKRLKSERWRRNFKLGFKAVVAKVQKMKKQGW